MDGAVDYSKDFFEKPVNLTVSGQLEAEAMAMAFGKVLVRGRRVGMVRRYSMLIRCV